MTDRKILVRTDKEELLTVFFPRMKRYIRRYVAETGISVVITLPRGLVTSWRLSHQTSQGILREWIDGHPIIIITTKGFIPAFNEVYPLTPENTKAEREVRAFLDWTNEEKERERRENG